MFGKHLIENRELLIIFEQESDRIKTALGSLTWLQLYNRQRGRWEAFGL